MKSSISKEKNEEVRLRILEALDHLNIPVRGRITKVAEKTDYSQGAVSGFLSGKTPINDRFIQIFWRNFEINPDWLETGIGKIPFIHILDHHHSPTLSSDLEEALMKFPIREALLELSKMSDVKLWRAVAMLKEMNEEIEG